MDNNKNIFKSSNTTEKEWAMEYMENNAAESSGSAANDVTNSDVATYTGSIVVENEEIFSDSKPVDAQSQNSDESSKVKETGFINIKDINIDKSYFGRLSQDADTVNLYKEAIIAGSCFPPIKLERSTNKLVDGGHTYVALRIIDKMCKKSELKKESLPNAFDGDLVRVEYVEIPKEKLPSFFAMTCNITHGQRPCPKDIYAIAKLQFEFNPNYGSKDLQKDMKFSPQAAGKYVKGPLEDRKAIVDNYIIEADKAGKTQTEIATDLKQKYPNWKGTSQASICNTLKEHRAKTKTNEAVSKTEIELDSNSNEDAPIVTDEEEPSAASVNSTPEDSESDSLSSEESIDSIVPENPIFIECMKVLDEVEKTILYKVEFLSGAEVEDILTRIELLGNNIENKAVKCTVIK